MVPGCHSLYNVIRVRCSESIVKKNVIKYYYIWSYHRKTPFATGANDPPATILSRIGTGEIDVTSGNWAYVSEPAKTLVRKMLNVDSAKRPFAKDIAQCHWLQSRHLLPSQAHPIEYPSSLKVMLFNNTKE